MVGIWTDSGQAMIGCESGFIYSAGKEKNLT